MPILRYIILLGAVGISALGFVMLQGQGFYLNAAQVLATLVNAAAVEDGATVTVRFQITPRDNPTTSYSDTEQFVQ